MVGDGEEGQARGQMSQDPRLDRLGFCEIMGFVRARARAVAHRKAGAASSNLVEGLVWLQQLTGPCAPSVGGSLLLPLGLPRPSPARPSD